MKLEEVKKFIEENPDSKSLLEMASESPAYLATYVEVKAYEIEIDLLNIKKCVFALTRAVSKNLEEKENKNESTK